MPVLCPSISDTSTAGVPITFQEVSQFPNPVYSQYTHHVGALHYIKVQTKRHASYRSAYKIHAVLVSQSSVSHMCGFPREAAPQIHCQLEREVYSVKLTTFWIQEQANMLLHKNDEMHT
jgi:hypothetical protein